MDPVARELIDRLGLEAHPEGEWYGLVTCVVAPGFDFAGFELAAPRWEPGSEP